MWAENLERVAELATIVVVGRLCLSLLPPGWPGYHDAREGGATLGASLFLGMLAWLSLPYVWLWGVLLAVRLALLPGAMRPRHELAAPPGKPLDRLSLLLALVALAWAAWRSPWSEAPAGFGAAIGEGGFGRAEVVKSALVAPALVVGSALTLHALLVRRRWQSAPRAFAVVLFAAAAVLLLARVPAWALGGPLLGVTWAVAGLRTFGCTADSRAFALGGLALGILGIGVLALAVWLVVPGGFG